MAREVSAGFHKTINSTEAAEFPVVLLEIDHDDLSSPIRVVNDRDGLTSNGDFYVGFAFSFTGVEDPEQGLAEAALTMDNVGKELVQWIDAANLRKPTTVRIQVVLPSDPNTIEFETTMFFDDISMDQTTVSGRLSYGVRLDEPAVAVRYTAQTAPGLFD